MWWNLCVEPAVPCSTHTLTASTALDNHAQRWTIAVSFPSYALPDVDDFGWVVGGLAVVAG